MDDTEIGVLMMVATIAHLPLQVYTISYHPVQFRVLYQLCHPSASSIMAIASQDQLRLRTQVPA